LAKAIYHVRKERFFCVNEFDLSKDILIEMLPNGNFKTTPSATEWMNLPPLDQVAEYIIRTAFQTIVKGPCARKTALENAKKKHPSNFEEHAIKQLANEQAKTWKEGSDHNIFHFTKLQPAFLFEYYHPLVEEALATGRKKEKWTAEPEQLQIVMVTSEILRSVFNEERVKLLLAPNVTKDSEWAYGSKEKAMENGHYLELAPARLPINGKSIDRELFRRTHNNTLAAVASFFALAIYDEKSFNLAIVLLEEPMKDGEPISQATRLFGQGFQDKPPQLGVGQENKSLFRRDIMDEGSEFYKRVVQVLNSFATDINSTTIYIDQRSENTKKNG
jgi:hypothetical protein